MDEKQHFLFQWGGKLDAISWNHGTIICAKKMCSQYSIES